MKETVAYLGLGTNLGDRRANLNMALDLLSAQPGLRLLRRSLVYETEPWGMADQPRYLNSVAEAETTLEPERLLDVCQTVEQGMGTSAGAQIRPPPDRRGYTALRQRCHPVAPPRNTPSQAACPGVRPRAAGGTGA